MLVLGATGAIGTHVVRACLARGWRVRALVRGPGRGRGPGALDGPDVELISGQLSDRAALDAAFGGCDAFVHAAGFYPTSRVSPARSVDHGLATVRPVLAAARAAGVGRGVYVSSATTVRPDEPRLPLPAAPDLPVREAALGGRPWTGRGGPYAVAKAAMEELALEEAAAGLPLAVVNPTLCLGEHDWKPTSGRLVLAVARGRIPVHPDGPVNVVYTGDVGEAIAAALVMGRPGARHVLAGDDTSLGWLLRQIAYELGARPPAVRVPLAFARAAARGADTIARVRRRPRPSLVGLELLAESRPYAHQSALGALGLGEPVSAVETVRRTVGWFRGSGKLGARSADPPS